MKYRQVVLAAAAAVPLLLTSCGIAGDTISVEHSYVQTEEYADVEDVSIPMCRPRNMPMWRMCRNTAESRM